MGTLRNKLVLNGISITKISRATGVHKAEVSAFVNNTNKCRRHSRRILREYFISIGFLPKPKPRKQYTCIDYECPDRLSRKQSTQSQKSNQS